jgi:hypothetical protein
VKMSFFRRMVSVNSNQFPLWAPSKGLFGKRKHYSGLQLLGIFWVFSNIRNPFRTLKNTLMSHSTAYVCCCWMCVKHFKRINFVGQAYLEAWISNSRIPES